MGPRICLLLVLMLLTTPVGCDEPEPLLLPGPSPARVAPASSATGKTITAAILGAPPTLISALAPPGPAPGVDALEELTNAGLVQLDATGALRPQLAEAVPSLDNGDWQVVSDGTMRTRWRIHPRAAWHDGTAFTAADLAFTLEVARAARPLWNPLYDLIEHAAAPDLHTFEVIWSTVHLRADQLFSRTGPRSYLPVARHRLERAFAQDPSSILRHPYWSDQYVGTGPYWMVRWVPGQHAAFEAWDGYVRGAPVVDTIEVRFVPSPTDLGRLLLDGSVDLVLGSSLGPAEARALAGRWSAGRVDPVPTGVVELTPNLLPPVPPALADVRFRRALLLALDRASWLEGQVPRTVLVPGDAEYAAVVERVPVYPFDPQQAAQLLEQVGYTRGADGLLVDAAGRSLALPVAAASSEPIAELLGDGWRQLGLSSTLVGPAASGGPAALSLARTSTDPRDLRRLSSTGGGSTAPPGGGQGRHTSPELDLLLDRYHTAVARAERLSTLADVLDYVAEHVFVMPLAYDYRYDLVSARALSISSGRVATVTWNADRWDVR